MDPSGPMSPTVYWRRRALAVGGVVLVVALAVWAAVALRGGETPSPHPEPQLKPVAPGPPPEPPVCADNEIRVAAEAAKPEFRVGERAGLRIVVTNVSDRECLRETNGTLRELVVSTPEGNRVWSSRDCHSESTNERPLLRPGQSVRNEVEWTGYTSTPECPVQREAAPAGEYSVIATLGPLTSPPLSFWLRG